MTNNNFNEFGRKLAKQAIKVVFVRGREQIKGISYKFHAAFILLNEVSKCRTGVLIPDVSHWTEPELFSCRK